MGRPRTSAAGGGDGRPGRHAVPPRSHAAPCRGQECRRRVTDAAALPSWRAVARAPILRSPAHAPTRPTAPVKNDSVLPRGQGRRRGPEFPPYDTAAVAAILDRWRDQPGNLLPILHGVQQALGFVPPGAVGQIAKAINRSRAEVHGVISFYHDFRTSQPGRAVLKLCQAESCQACGSRELTAHAERTLGCKLGETSPDGAVTLEPVYCLGNCACSPAALLDGELHGRVTPQGLDRLLAQARRRP
ncbi:MAG: formate dehydrogenase subunit gamma [Planctomycetes bacterium]|nr:formate dehydrogenase subunit gamma [Planctomycetota bacterium]